MLNKLTLTLSALFLASTFGMSDAQAAKRAVWKCVYIDNYGWHCSIVGYETV